MENRTLLIAVILLLAGVAVLYAASAIDASAPAGRAERNSAYHAPAAAP
jgi:hypothetical protein